MLAVVVARSFFHSGGREPSHHAYVAVFRIERHLTAAVVLRIPWPFSLWRICTRGSSSVFISPPMRNLPSPIGLLALVMELLCSRFRMSWNHCASVSFGLPDGACTLTTSMPSSSPSPGMVHRKACAVRRCPCTLYTFFKIRPCVHLQRLSSHIVR